MGFERVEADPLVGGVLVDKIHAALLVLADDVGFQHLTGNAPGRFLLCLDAHLLRRGVRQGDLPGGFRRLCLFRRRCDFIVHACFGSGRGKGLPLLPYRIAEIQGVNRGFDGRCGRRHGRTGGVGAQRLALRLRRFFPKRLRRHCLIEGRLGFLRRRHGVAVQCIQHRVVDRVKHGPVGQEFHHRLGRVDIHIHLRGRQGDMQHAAGELALEHPVAIGLLQSRRQQLGLDKAAVDEEHLLAPCAVAA